MTVLRQIVIVAALNLRNLRHRFWQSLVIVIGMACVTGVLLSMMSVTEGLHQAHLNSGDPRNVIIVSHGSIGDGGSAIPRDQAAIVLNAPGIARMPDGSPLSDAAFLTGIQVKLEKNGNPTYIRLQTLGKNGAALMPGFHLVAGRMFRPGTHELIVGSVAQTRFRDMRVGGKVIMPNGQWPIVGIFSTGRLEDGVLIGDTETVMQAMRRNTYNKVTARLTSPEAFPAFQKSLYKNPTLYVDAWRIPEWNALSSAQTAAFFNVLVYGISIILAIGALFGCFNTMYAAVESRRREIATFRALGYGSLAVAASVILEAGLLAVAGALIGAAIAWALYDGLQGNMGWDLFKLTVSPAMIGMALSWAAAVALLGGLVPSIRAARQPVAMALRAT